VNVARYGEVLTSYKTELQKRLDEMKRDLEVAAGEDGAPDTKELLLENDAVIFGATELCDDVAKMIPEMDGEIAKAFEETDANGSGNLGFEEFKLGFTKVFVSCMDDKADINTITEEYRMATFDNIDANHNRLLSRGEFAVYCRHLMAKATVLTIEAGSVKLFSDKVQAMTGTGVALSESQSTPAALETAPAEAAPAKAASAEAETSSTEAEAAPSEAGAAEAEAASA
jgi:hypothetical protein